MTTLLLLSIIWILLALSPQVCGSDKIQLLNSTNFKSQMINEKNTTYLLDPAIIKAYENNSFFIEMQLESKDIPVEECEIVFAFSKEKALYQESKSNLLAADEIDTNAFFLRKKYFRLVINLNIEDIKKYSFYLTIFQNQESIHQIEFKIQIGYSYNQKNNQKKCPFDCIGNGVCDTLFGICNCNKGFFGNDCSTHAFSLEHFKQDQEEFDFQWHSTFTKNDGSIFFYQKVPTSFNNKTILTIQSLTQQYQGSFLILFATYLQYKMEFQHQYTVSSNELNNGVEIPLQIQQKRNLQLQDQSITGDSTSQISEYLIGFILQSEITVELSLNLRYERNYADNQSMNGNQNQDHNIVLILFLVLIFLIVLLIGLIICLYQRNGMITQILRQQRMKKYQKEEEQNKILQLIPLVKYSQYLRNEMKSSEDSEEPCCSVCLCEFEEEENIRKTYCPHYFHNDCITSWLLKQKNCPHCRNSMTIEDIENKLKNDDLKVKKDQKVVEKEDLSIGCSIRLISSSVNPLQQINQYMQQIDDIPTNNSPACRNSPAQKGKEEQDQEITASNSVQPPKMSIFNPKRKTSRYFSSSKNEEKIFTQQKITDRQQNDETPMFLNTDMNFPSVGNESNKHFNIRKQVSMKIEGGGSSSQDSFTIIKRYSKKQLSVIPKKDSSKEE